MGTIGRDPSVSKTNACAQDLFIEGLFTLQKIVNGMVFFKLKVNACNSIHPTTTYDFWRNHLKLPYFTYTANFFWKEDCKSNNMLNIFSLGMYVKNTNSTLDMFV